MTRSGQLFEEAKQYIPGGVNSPVRAFRAVGSHPLFMRSASGAHIEDEDGHTYIDYVGSWGPAILGHAHPAIVEAVREAALSGLSFGAATAAETELARRICTLVPSVQQVRLTSSGTEAVMSAVRLARGFTGRDKIIKFEGCYHGHSDAMLVKAGSGVLTAGMAGSAGVTDGAARDTLVARFNDIGSVARLFRENSGRVAAVIAELMPANVGVILPEDGFLQELAALCRQQEALLIADEVITGFRLGLGGAQVLFGITPDLTTLGKVVGGGMPVGAFGGRADIMRHVAPLGGVYQAGTLSGHPLAMAAGNAQLQLLQKQPEIYTRLEALTKRLADGLREISRRLGVRTTVNQIGSLLSMFFAGGPVRDDTVTARCDTAAYARYFHAMLRQGIYLAPSQYEAAFVSAAHNEEDIDKTLRAAETVLPQREDEGLSTAH